MKAHWGAQVAALGMAALALLFGGAGRAQADPITVSLGGDSFTAFGDTVTLLPNTITVDLTLGGVVVVFWEFCTLRALCGHPTRRFTRESEVMKLAREQTFRCQLESLEGDTTLVREALYGLHRPK